MGDAGCVGWGAQHGRKHSAPALWSRREPRLLASLLRVQQLPGPPCHRGPGMPETLSKFRLEPPGGDDAGPPPSPDVPEPQLELTRSRLTPGVLGPPYQGRPAGWARAPRSPPLPLWDLEQQALLSVPSLGCHRARSGSRPKARSSPLGGSGGTGDALPHPCSRDHSSVRESAVSAWTSGVPGCDREGQARGGRRLCVKRRFEQDRKCGVAGVWKEL